MYMNQNIIAATGSTAITMLKKQHLRQQTKNVIQLDSMGSSI